MDVNYALFQIQSGKFYTWQIFLHRHVCGVCHKYQVLESGGSSGLFTCLDLPSDSRIVYWLYTMHVKMGTDEKLDCKSRRED